MSKTDDDIIHCKDIRTEHEVVRLHTLVLTNDIGGASYEPYIVKGNPHHTSVSAESLHDRSSCGMQDLYHQRLEVHVAETLLSVRASRPSCPRAARRVVAPSETVLRRMGGPPRRIPQEAWRS